MKDDKSIKKQLSVSLDDALQGYMRNLNGQSCTGLYQVTIDMVENRLIKFSLQHCKGNMSATAKMLGISRTTLARKMAAHGVRDK